MYRIARARVRRGSTQSPASRVDDLVFDRFQLERRLIVALPISAHAQGHRAILRHDQFARASRPSAVHGRDWRGKASAWVPSASVTSGNHPAVPSANDAMRRGSAAGCLYEGHAYPPRRAAKPADCAGPCADIVESAKAITSHVWIWHFCDIAIGRADVRSWGMSGPKIRRDLKGCHAVDQSRQFMSSRPS